MRQGAELLGAGHEVRLAVDFDHHTHTPTAVRVDLDHAVGGIPVGALGGGGHAFFPQPVHRLLEIAIRLPAAPCGNPARLRPSRRAGL